MGGPPNIISCYVPYLCALAVAVSAYGLSGGRSPFRLAVTAVLGWIGAVASVMAVDLAHGHGGTAILGGCSPLHLGAAIFGAITSIGLFYDVRRHLTGGLGRYGRAPDGRKKI